MKEERERIRCRHCELVQWSEQENCRRCGAALPQPIVKFVERVVEKVVVRQDPQCLEKLEQARQLIAAASAGMANRYAGPMRRLFFLNTHPRLVHFRLWRKWSGQSSWPHIRDQSRPLKATWLLGIGKTTLYRKLHEIGHAAAESH